MSVKMVKANIIDLDTGEKTALNPKPNSRCLFKDMFKYKNYEIQLRLDNNNNPSVDPVLDADIEDLTTGKLIKHGTWHHTEKQYNHELNIYMYSFNFEGLPLKLSVEITYQLQLKSDAMVVTDKLTLTLVRGENEKINP